MEPIRYRPNSSKAASAVVYMLGRDSDLGLADLSWIFYRAEREHINDYGRPVFGLNYGDEGGMPKCRELLEMAVSGERSPIMLVSGQYKPVRGVGVEMDLFSVSDFRALDRAQRDFRAMSTHERLEAMPDGWNAGDIEWFGYENMIDGKSEEIVLEIASIAPYVAI